jgi:preprotein translocase subunit YajC
MIENLKRGDKVVTSGGITGIVERVIDNDKVEVEIAENVKVEIIKSSGIQGLLNTTEIKK